MKLGIAFGIVVVIAIIFLSFTSVAGAAVMLVAAFAYPFVNRPKVEKGTITMERLAHDIGL